MNKTDSPSDPALPGAEGENQLLLRLKELSAQVEQWPDIEQADFHNLLSPPEIGRVLSEMQEIYAQLKTEMDQYKG